MFGRLNLTEGWGIFDFSTASSKNVAANNEIVGKYYKCDEIELDEEALGLML